jgi:gamma-glutamyltranspeptidase/glutathione hydrolase
VAADRPRVLSEGADGAALRDPTRLDEQRAAVDPERRSRLAALAAPGGTVACCAVDRDRMGVTLIQSNASGWGAELAEPETGIFLHDRGIGFSLEPGHPADYGPGRRPPHTLAPALVTRPDGSLRTVLGTMGGDAQPQILVQLLARLLHHGEEPGDAVDAGRWVLGVEGRARGRRAEATVVEAHASGAWDAGLQARGHTVERRSDPLDHAFGHAQVIDVDGDDGVLNGASDPRAVVGAASGY